MTEIDAGSAENAPRFPQLPPRRFLARAALLVLLTVVCYLPAMRAGYVWDDDDHLTANVAVASPHGLQMIWSSLSRSRYYPLTLTTFWVEHKLWGYNPQPYHLVNILLHAASAVLVFLLLNALDVPGAWVAAAIWSVHPINVESVAWITELKNVQSGFLYFLSLLCWLRFRMQRRSGWYWLAMLLFACALLSKPSTVVLPLMLVLLAWWRRERWTTPDFLRLVPLAVLACGMSALAVVEQRGNIGRSGLQDWSLSIPQRLALAGRDIWFYASKVLWPAHLNFVYPHWEMNLRSFVPPLLAVLSVVVLLWIYRRRPATRAFAFGLGYFVIALLPILGFVNVFYFRYSYVADHFQYLADIGIIGLVVGSVAGATRPSVFRSAAVGLVIASFGMLSWQRCEAFHDEETLWRDTLVKNPGSWLAHNNLGSLLLSEGRLEEAIQHWEQAVRIEPTYAEAHSNLGNALLQEGKTREAMAQFEEALRIKPDSAETQINWGDALFLAGRVQDAVGHYELALHSKPDSAKAHYNLGRAYQQLGKLSDAIQEYKRAVQSQPDFFEAHNNLGDALRQTGRLLEATGEFWQALRIKPDDPRTHYNLGLALSQMGKAQEAIDQYEEALRIDPHYASAHNNLGNALLQAGRVQDAIGHFEQALRLNPNYAVGHYNFGNALLQAGRPNDAIAQYQDAVRLNPNLTQAREMLARLSSSQ